MRLIDPTLVLPHARALRPFALLAAASLALAVAQASLAQSQVQGTRVGTQIGGTRVGGSSGGTFQPSQFLGGRGQGLGDGNALGGQTFRWSQTTGAGRAAGSGNVLDANSQLGSGGANSSLVPLDYNSRNLLVTGSVPGGRGFRGSVGYTADTDFRARVGSDDSYAFRADSAFSNPAFVTSPIARDRFLVSQGLGVFEYRRESTPLGGVAPVVDQPDSRLRLDRANAQMSFGRLNRELGSDREIATSTSSTGVPLRYVMSPLRGLQIEAIGDPLARSGLSVYERARARQDIAAGLATMDDYKLVRDGISMQAPDSRRVDLRLKGDSAADRLRAESTKVLPKSYLDIVDSINKTGSNTNNATTNPADPTKPVDPANPMNPSDAAQTPLDQVRDTLAPMRPKFTRPGELKPEAKPEDKPKPAPGDLVVPQGIPVQNTETGVEARRAPILSVEDAALILRHGKKIDTLSRDDRRRVDELVQQGESALRDGDYFRAERRFEQAQALASENPLVEAGIAHAQLGAGLYLSSSLTLRNLFVAFPELIDAKYDRTLLPSPERLTEAVKLIRTRMIPGQDQPGYGLLLAYIGHQTVDRAMVEEGLAVIAGSEKLDLSRKLLEGIWLGPR